MGSPAVVNAVVTNNADPMTLGRIKFMAPAALGLLESEWALSSTPYPALPQIGDPVYAAFMDDDISRPVWFASRRATGTPGQIVVSPAGVVSLDPNLVLGTVVTGVWNGTPIALAHGGTGATNAADARAALVVPSIFTTPLDALVAYTELVVVHGLNTFGVTARVHVRSTGQELGLGLRAIDSVSMGVTADIAYGASLLRLTVVG